MKQIDAPGKRPGGERVALGGRFLSFRVGEECDGGGERRG